MPPARPALHAGLVFSGGVGNSCSTHAKAHQSRSRIHPGPNVAVFSLRLMKLFRDRLREIPSPPGQRAVPWKAQIGRVFPAFLGIFGKSGVPDLTDPLITVHDLNTANPRPRQ